MWLLNTALGCALILVVLTLMVPPLRASAWLPASLALTLGGVAVVGVWLVTQRDPAATDREPLLTWRRVLRVAVVSAVVLEVGDDALAHAISGARSLALPASLLGSGMWILVILAAFRHAISLARLVPDHDLVQQTRGTMWGLICSYAVASAMAAIVFSRAALPPILTALFGLSCTVIVACVIFTLWSMSLIARYAQVLSMSADAAELTWKHERATPRRQWGQA
jgi:hypothetical protein